MSELQIGDKVQTISSNGTVTYSEVTGFIKKWPNQMTQYKSIATVNETITLTGNHLVYARKYFAEQFYTIYADELLIGDEVLVQQNYELTPVKVTNVSELTLQGAYVALTKEGMIMVDGVLASCYAEVPHDVAHLTLTSMLRFSAVMEWIFGEDTGLPVYVITLNELGSLMLPNYQFWSY